MIASRNANARLYNAIIKETASVYVDQFSLKLLPT